MNEQLLILLRCLGKGDKQILLQPDGTYANIEVAHWQGYEKARVVSIESQLQYELFGEHPLSGQNVDDWDLRIKPIFSRYL